MVHVWMDRVSASKDSEVKPVKKNIVQTIVLEMVSAKNSISKNRPLVSAMMGFKGIIF